MKIIGITGGIACGKSEATKYLIQRGFTIIDCDEINRQLQLNDSAIITKIQAEFPDVFENGRLIKEELAQQAFSSTDNLNKITQIMQPAIFKKIIDLIFKYHIEQKKIIFLDAPLLFETNLQKLCEKIICIYVPKKIQQKRFLEREGMTPAIFKLIQSIQLPLEQKKQRSDVCILSDTLPNLHEQLDNFIRETLDSFR